jgi:outer membrane protein assembly factor BamB
VTTGLIVGLLVLLAALFTQSHATAAQMHTANWPTYLGDNGHTGFNRAETVINPGSAPNLKLLWSRQVVQKITTQPIEANGMLYWGSWDGTEHASSLTDGSDIWTANLGQTTSCRGTVFGVLSTATVANVTIAGVSTPVDFVGGGDNNLYALDASTGALIWHTQLGSPPSSFLYSSPTVFNGSVYIGVSGNADCSHVQGQLVQLDAATGTILHTFDVVPTGCIGGSVWTSPTINERAGLLYFSTGEAVKCASPEPMTVALVALNAADLSFVGSWQVPTSELIPDGDFGSSPTLFQATINGTSYQMVGLINKSGIYYAFDQQNVSNGPLWKVRLATAPGPSLSSSAWDGTNLYVASGNTVVKGTTCPGALRALNPSNGAILWEDCLTFDPFGPVTAVPGVVAIGTHKSFTLFDTITGNQLFSYEDNHGRSNFLGPAMICNGVLYEGNEDGTLFAFTPQ